MTALKARWLSWGDLPWLSRSEAGGGILQLAERLLEASLEASTPTSFLNRRLPEITTEFSAQWCSVYKRTPQWTRVAESGRRGFEEIPHRVLDEVLDRDAGGFYADGSADGWRFLAAPLGAAHSNHRRRSADGGSQSVGRIAAGRRRHQSRAGDLLGESSSGMPKDSNAWSVWPAPWKWRLHSRERASRSRCSSWSRTRRRESWAASGPASFLWDRYHHELVARPGPWDERAKSATARHGRRRGGSRADGQVDSRRRCLSRSPLRQERRRGERVHHPQPALPAASRHGGQFDRRLRGDSTASTVRLPTRTRRRSAQLGVPAAIALENAARARADDAQHRTVDRAGDAGRADHRRESGDRGTAGDGRSAGRDRSARTDSGRERHRQRGRSPIAAFSGPAGRAAIHRRQLRRPRRIALGKRTVSATRRGPLPTLAKCAAASSSWPKGARCFSTRSAT